MSLIILDRDGVINADSDRFIKSPEEWHPIPGSLAAIARLNHAGYQVVIATNQSGIARGLFDLTTLNAIHQKMIDALAQQGGLIEAIFFCPHARESRCHCRKPAPGLFEEIGQRYNTSLQGVPAIGDSLRDLVAAERAGAQPILVLTGKGQKTLETGNLPPGTLIHENLQEAVRTLLAKH
ncbi:D-glycero-beta-D-manno-heptose 1,7-bisphosphate 7-phosphatase [Ferrovum myxofaciens]|jgi:D-glycero-D-manno-heptose 1,7-bisphosphate phosphatase|uniref:D,D-heptose 1,7-bisphosphate phosphatase n=3 Tax=root TaxID=1 RepID=A0A859A7V7_9PROT|nr:D-glycero-beta-D-manno-heptose 1,7-bisphosphate 7-phosphatase [Ferrovum myxofaciens]MBW8029235.1 D-glycero-beta-D-manno-heptose 1,7-bisphosphate 7-phosphatase [Ferrovum sp.]KXW57963.1 D-glycero-beta-D-manno-heptose-1,7-bisphosphate 7-phosphatase [Ferrovum myxofaciens]MBU6994450.1 D-glycero-beta-D-manno-heptose 1,7-bisphosphate 7-phosphatase [Ferrovum myxofaciens]NDU88964.1 D-glycero-beta-D-manno-heptose 1,7-bisphosphate 7-phosphatase [Ferrovum sp.]QKE38324.1 MAG: D-glycero-beta-D-manno-hept